MAEQEIENTLDLSDRELEEARARSAIGAHILHEAVRREGEQELQRPSSALAWSGFAAGLSMGFSLIGEGLIRSRLPDAPWRPLLSKLGYTFGFLLVILGRQQLFTENTLTPILPLLVRPNLGTLRQVGRLWSIVLATNLAGALAIAWVLGNTGAFRPEVQKAFAEIGNESLSVGFGLALLRGVFAGWLIALLVWILPFTEAFRVVVIVLLTWLIAVGGFTHVIAGSIEVLFLATTGAAAWNVVVGSYIVPTLIGNILGGVSLVAALNHAQVVSH
ncbi:MAG TPA: formate/nitrite transporter family protein [Bryobacteraceae bacterium]|nr:formate/nitrite transporter family protein [Bryobacteraceae bacterium]